MPGRVNEKTTSQYSGQLVDENNDNLTLAALATLTLTLYDDITGAIINGWDSKDIKNANGFTVGTTGAVTGPLSATDNAIFNQALDTELHVMLFQGTYGGGGSKSLKHIFTVRVVNLSKVS